MTTAPVITITEELLSELEDKAKASNSIGPWYTTKDICAFTHNEEDEAFVIAASPATLIALVEHIRSLTERLEKAEKDAGRIDFLVRKEAVVLEGRLGFWLHFQREDIEQNGEYESARSAIDAAIAQEGQSNE